MNYRSLLTFRLFCAFAISTAFAPDEFWQGPEVAHRLVFGCVFNQISFDGLDSLQFRFMTMGLHPTVVLQVWAPDLGMGRWSA